MISDAYRKNLLLSALRRVGVMVGVGISIALVNYEIAGLDTPEVQMIARAAYLVALVVPVVLLLGLRLKPTRPLFDHRVPRHVLFTAVDGMVLTRKGKEIEALCIRLGIAPLSQYLVLALPPLTFHDAGAGVDWAAALIAALEKDRAGMKDGEKLLAAFVALRSNLEDAKAAGARFCLRPIGGMVQPIRMLYDAEV